MKASTLASVVLLSTALGGPAAGPLSPEKESASFRLADEGLTVELAASEPEVLSPVACAWDADGRLFVAEMIDYPAGPPVGQVRLLEDRDGDGHYETATVFADGLAFPNSVLAWKGGVLVTAAPDLLFLKDTDHDGKADERRVLFTGFGEGNPQLRANGLTWGLDHWIYGANGRSEGEIRRAGQMNGGPISIRGHDFRFRPDTLAFEPVAGRSQFGLTRDDWGNRFLSWNTIPIRHEVFPERYLARNRYLPVTQILQDLLPSDDSGRVFPLTPPPTTFNNESTSHFNALAGLTIYRGDALGPAYRGNAFVGESLRNLVHRRVLEPKGATFTAKRGEESREFLASTDPWFHPVNFGTGPDGALYIADFYRKWVEHPGFVHSKARDEIDWREGARHGRIWRVVRKTRPRPPNTANLKLSQASVSELVKHLEDDNGWWRDTAQRLLVERQDPAAIPLLARLVREAKEPVARVQALFTLDALNAVDDQILLMVLRDSPPRLRESALRLAEPRLNFAGPVRQAVFARADDADARVRLQLALSLGFCVDDASLSTLARLADAGASDRWLSVAILSSVGPRAWPCLQQLVRSNERWQREPTLEQADFLERLAGLVGATNPPYEALPFFALLADAQTGPEAQIALLAGYADGLKRFKQTLREALKRPPLNDAERARSLTKVFTRAASTASSTAASASQRLRAVRLLASAEPQMAGPALLKLLRASTPAAIQTAAARAIAELADPTLARALFDRWDRFGPGTRRIVLAASLNSPVTAAALAAALEQNTVLSAELDAPTRDAWRRTAGPDLRPRLDKLLKSRADDNRGEIVRRFALALDRPGDLKHGAELFAKNCLACHALQGRGQRVGPDLSSVASRPAETLLADILDPSREVSPDFISYTLTTTDGEAVSGLIAGETAVSINLRRANQPDETILRSQIKELRATGKSLMPDGMEQGLNPQDLADLIAFLREPDAGLLPKEE